MTTKQMRLLYNQNLKVLVYDIENVIYSSNLRRIDDEINLSEYKDLGQMRKPIDMIHHAVFVATHNHWAALTVNNDGQLIIAFGDKKRIEGEELEEGDNFYNEPIIDVKPLRMPLFNSNSNHLIIYYPSSPLQSFPLDFYTDIISRRDNGQTII